MRCRNAGADGILSPMRRSWMRRAECRAHGPVDVRFPRGAGRHGHCPLHDPLAAAAFEMAHHGAHAHGHGGHRHHQCCCLEQCAAASFFTVPAPARRSARGAHRHHGACSDRGPRPCRPRAPTPACRSRTALRTRSPRNAVRASPHNSIVHTPTPAEGDHDALHPARRPRARAGRGHGLQPPTRNAGRQRADTTQHAAGRQLARAPRDSTHQHDQHAGDRRGRPPTRRRRGEQRGHPAHARSAPSPPPTPGTSCGRRPASRCTCRARDRASRPMPRSADSPPITRRTSRRLIDGVPLNETVSGHAEGYADWNAMIPEAVNGVEIDEGAGVAVGGELRDGRHDERDHRADDLGTEWSARFGSLRRRARAVAHRLREGEDGGWMLAADLQRADGWRENSHEALGHLMLSKVWFGDERPDVHACREQVWRRLELAGIHHTRNTRRAISRPPRILPTAETKASARCGSRWSARHGPARSRRRCTRTAAPGTSSSRSLPRAASARACSRKRRRLDQRFGMGGTTRWAKQIRVHPSRDRSRLPGGGGAVPALLHDGSHARFDLLFR